MGLSIEDDRGPSSAGAARHRCTFSNVSLYQVTGDRPDTTGLGEWVICQHDTLKSRLD